MTETPNDYGWWADRFVDGYEEGHLPDVLEEWGLQKTGTDSSAIAARCKTLLMGAHEELFSKKYYVLGFMFNADSSKVKLIRKARPEWQAGRLNGIGGKIEGDEVPRQAMQREFREEAGVATKCEEWQHVVTLRSADWEVYVYGMSSDLYFEQCEAMTDEPLETHKVGIFLATEDCISNLHWLIPLARNPKNIILPVLVEHEK